MSTLTADWLEAIDKLPADSVVTLHHIAWDEYEELLDQVGAAGGLRVSYDGGTLQVTTLSPEHESYAEFISGLVRLLSVRLRINIRFFGSTTIKKRGRARGTEPDACFYVQSAAAIGNRMQLDFAADPPPDVAVEVDLHHQSLSKFPIYAALGVPEVWRYDGRQLTIHLLQEETYVPAAHSRALPMLTDHLLTEFLTRLREAGDFQAILAFDEWLQTQQP
ncbi:MAG: Uma2 family endonuclease [Acidobacteria bacterium]|nr:Uma2 family endonuclease [Acidobacteriota bacterium]